MVGLLRHPGTYSLIVCRFIRSRIIFYVYLVYNTLFLYPLMHYFATEGDVLLPRTIFELSFLVSFSSTCGRLEMLTDLIQWNFQ